MPTVFIADKVASDCVSMLTQTGFDVINKPGLEQAEKLQCIANADALIVRSATTVDKDMLNAAPNLKVIGRAGTGVDNIDLDAAAANGVWVMNAPGQNTLAAAEHSFALMMTMCRNIPAANARMCNGEWSKKGLMGCELDGKTLGLIGLGRIGREVAKRALAFNMTVIGSDPFLSSEGAAEWSIKKVELEEVFANADIISLHAPLTPETRHVLNGDSLQKCKDGVRIVNCARGGLIDDNALVAALQSGKVASAALDVFEVEPLPQDHPFLNSPQVIATPHLGASTAESQVKVATAIARQFDAFFNRGEIQFAVNEPVVHDKTASAV
ncbi:MAG: hydroxyacid dehydrogenase [Planctomycetota bacterium]|jgi:D-3-phosphoglycerate dehydrogenase|nr:hydroxyacid dehydrogenase [Planctomycetota bacterium]